MRIEIISTGDEVITGNIDDTNASYLSRELIDAGLQVDRRLTVGDNLQELMEVIKVAASQPSVVIMTGGLGPTNDDLTTEAAARVADKSLELNEEWLERMKFWFSSRGRTMSQSNMKQAMLPQGALMINNPVGTACGFALKINQGLFIFCPGVPQELKAMWESSVKEMVLSFTKDTVPRTHLIRLFLMGIGESNLAELLSKLTLPESVVIGDRAIYPLIELKLIGHDASDQDMISALNQLMPVIAPYYVCRDSFSLQELLAQKNIKLEPLNAVDGLCRGWFLIHLQKLCSEFISCTVLNKEDDKLGADALQQQADLLEHIPNRNRLTLLPYKEPQRPDAADPYPFHYELSYQINLTEQEQPRTISGRILMQFSNSIFKHGTYSRNRDFLAQLCCVEIYKALVREPLLKPEDCSIQILEQQDSMPHAPQG